MEEGQSKPGVNMLNRKRERKINVGVNEVGIGKRKRIVIQE